MIFCNFLQKYNKELWNKLNNNGLFYFLKSIPFFKTLIHYQKLAGVFSLKLAFLLLLLSEPYILGELGDNTASVGLRKNYPWYKILSVPSTMDSSFFRQQMAPWRPNYPHKRLWLLFCTNWLRLGQFKISNESKPGNLKT